MPNVYDEVADKISADMSKYECDFSAAFKSVMQNYKELDWSTTRRKVGSLLGRRPKRNPSVVAIEKILKEARHQELLDGAQKAHDYYISTVDERDW